MIEPRSLRQSNFAEPITEASQTLREGPPRLSICFARIHVCAKIAQGNTSGNNSTALKIERLSPFPASNNLAACPGAGMFSKTRL
jgi:hypothetical protein